ncbi:MAG: hypothetical protein HYZ89_00305 [Candidatus Omnitrophica bacterium]|nr:hypothetical protein [Candidatus Omnitrophota bacterium]
MRAVIDRAMQRNAHGQSTAEYAVMLGVVVAAIVGMQIYVKRGMNARLKDASDSAIAAMWAHLKGGTPTLNDQQYEPYYTSSNYTVDQTADHQEQVATGGVATKSNISETTTRTGSQSVKVAVP